MCTCIYVDISIPFFSQGNRGKRGPEGEKGEEVGIYSPTYIDLAEDAEGIPCKCHTKQTVFIA